MNDWMDEIIEVRGLIFDTAKCYAYLRPREPERISLESNFHYTKESSVHWFDEASYGMCTHFCEKEELPLVLELLKGTEPGQWRFTLKMEKTPVTQEVKDKILELIENCIIK